MDWVWEVLKLALAPGMPPGVDLPRVVYMEDLEHVRLKRWMCLGAALTVTDRYVVGSQRHWKSAWMFCCCSYSALEAVTLEFTFVLALRYTHPAGRSGFATPELARRFRAAAFAKHGISSSLESGSVPHTITVLSNVYGEKVRKGSLQLICMLQHVDAVCDPSRCAGADS